MAVGQMATERPGAATFKGQPLTLIGPALKVGDPAPAFTLLDQALAPVTLSDSAGQVRLISVVPSLDTPVCDAQTRRFNEAAAQTDGAVVWLTVSADLPFAQARFCTTAHVEAVQVLSDHRAMAFGQAYGTLIKELRLLSRAIFIVDRQGILRYVQYVPEVANHPNYEAALNTLKAGV